MGVWAAPAPPPELQAVRVRARAAAAPMAVRAVLRAVLNIVGLRCWDVIVSPRLRRTLPPPDLSGNGHPWRVFFVPTQSGRQPDIRQAR
ncbi:hypothetical protein CELD12_32780 [Cellulomonas sp. NTE-D12]|nr:hypothetical protein CELD12_32780 [Cellulomonas sp. NTE-D12]